MNCPVAPGIKLHPPLHRCRSTDSVSKDKAIKVNIGPDDYSILKYFFLKQIGDRKEKLSFLRHFGTSHNIFVENSHSPYHIQRSGLHDQWIKKNRDLTGRLNTF